MDKTPLHVVLGSGQVGELLAAILASQDKTVRLVRRRAAGDAIAGVRRVSGDITESAFATEVCEGADVIYNCLNPAQYHRWHEVLPPLSRAANEAAIRSGARLVVLDNFYMLGSPEAVPFDEDAPIAPASKKGELRARLARELEDAQKRGDLVAATGRASDYFGPRCDSVVVFRQRFFERLAVGKPVEVLGDPDQPHSYSYTPDVARGLAILGDHKSAAGKIWNLPVAAQLTTRELIERFASAAKTTAKIRAMPAWALRTLGFFIPVVGAVAEMLHQWQAPFVASDERFRRTFGANATPLDVAIAETLECHGIAAHRRAA